MDQWGFRDSKLGSWQRSDNSKYPWPWNWGESSSYHSLLSRNLRDTTTKVWHSMLNRESILRQKYHHRWIKNGDLNSKFFHTSMRSKNHRNNICSLGTPSGRLAQVDEVKQKVKRSFKDFFREPNYSRPILDGVQFKRIWIDEKLALEAPFSLYEVKDIF